MYADKDFYTNQFYGKLIPDAELDSFLIRASDSVDQLTFFRIGKRGGIDKLTAFQQKQIKLAVCEQADFLYGVQDMPQFVNSYNAGNVSVSRNDQRSINYSERAVNYLRPTGLMYRGLGS